jgi:hypothetical protein
MMNRLSFLRRAAAIASLLALASFPIMAPSPSAKADDVRRFVISAHDGYDLEECMTSASSCAQLVANAWCDAKGYQQAIAFEPLKPEDITASLAGSSLRPNPRNAVVITCSR